MFINGKWQRLYAPDSGGTDGGASASGTASGDGSDEVDYKAMYEKAMADNQKLVADYQKAKQSFDKTASEVAELKRQSKAKMSEEEQRAAEREEEQKRFQETLAQLNSIKTANVFAKAGFDEKDYGAVSAKLVESCGDKASEIAETLIEFVKKSTTAAVANAQRASQHDNIILPNASNGQKEQHLYAKLASDNNGDNGQVDKIKEFYRKK